MERCFGVGCERDVGQSQKNLFDTDVKLQAGQIRAETPVDACAKSEVPVRFAIEHTAIRVGEFLSVTVGRGKVEQDRFTGAEGVSAQLDVFRDSSRNSVNRSGKANELFNGPGHDLGFTDEPIAFLGMRCE